MEELSLKWDEHHPAVISVFEELLAKGTLVDCTIAADGQYMKAHKVVLAACSPYFEMLFSQESEKNPIVVLKDMKFQELKHLIDFVYRGQVKLPKDQLDAFVSAAESLQIKGLSGQQKKKISERFANKTVSSREVCSSPVPRKRRRNSHTETNEDSQSEPGNESSSDSNMRENFMPTPIPLGMPSTSTASSSTGISSHSVSSQQSRSLTDTRFPSHDQSSASSEQVLPDVQTVVKTEPEDPTEPLAQVFVPEPKNEEYVDDMAMLESGAGSSDMQGGTSQENTNNYPGYDSSGDTFLMNQMADQNTSSGAASPGGRSAVLAAGVPASHRRLASMARARVTAGSARTARLFAQARARRLHQQHHHHHRRRRQQQRRQSHAATPTTSTAEDDARRKAAKTARAALGTSPAAARSMERLLSKWSPVVVLHDIAKSLPATAATTSKTKPPLREATAPESEHSASGRQRQDADSPSTVVSEAEEVAAAAAASQREDAEDSSPSSVVSVAGSEDGVVRSAAPGDAPVTASSKAPGRGDAVTITQDDGEEVPLSAVAPVTPSPSAASARPAGRRAPSDSAVPETASLPPGGTSLDLDRPLASRTGAGARQRKASTSAEVAMRTPRKQTASAPPASEQPLRATRRSTAGGDKRRPEASTQKPLSARKRSRKLDAVTSKTAEAPEGVPDAVAGPSSAGTAAPDRPKSRAQSAPPQESSGNTGPRRKSRRISEAATSAGADTATNASVADEDDRLLSERLVSRSQSAPPQETSDESKKAQRKRSRKKSEAATSAAADSATPATGASASTPEIVADGGESPLPERSVSRSRSAPPQETTDGGKKAPRRRSGKTSEAATCVVADIATEASGDAKTAPVTVVAAGEELTVQPLSKRSMSRSEPAPPQESSAGKALRKRSRKKSETRTSVVADIVIERSGDDDSTPVTVVAAGEELTAQPLSERSVPRIEPAPPQETSAGKTARKRSRKKSEAAASVVADIVIETSGDGDSTVFDAGEELTAQPLSERSVSRSEPTPPQETAEKTARKRSRKKSETPASENVESAPKSADADPPEVITFAPLSVADDPAESSDKSDDLPLSHRVSSESTRLRETSAASPVVVELESSPSPEETSALCHLPSFSPLPDRSLSDDYMSAIDDEDVLLDPGATPRSEMSGRMSVMSDYSTASLWTETCPSPPRDATGQYMYSPLDDDAPVVIKRKTRRKSGQYVYTLMDDDDDMPLEARASPEPSLAERWARSRSATPGAERSSKAGARRGKADRKAAAAGWRSADELTPDAHASRRRRPRGRPRKVASEAAASRRSASRARSATPAKDDLREIDGAAAAVAAVGAASLMAEHFPTAVTCETCGSQLGSVADLRRHVLYKHTLSPLAAKEKRWRCRECGRPFVHESSLRSHEKRAHERPHACAHCAERFALAADLLAHRAAHHRGKAEAEEEVASD